MNKQEIIKQGAVEKGVYFLPLIELDRKEYLEIAEYINFLGGKWTRGIKGFKFDREIKTVNDLIVDETKKELQFFQTPPDLADEMIELAELKEGEEVLEPSAGRGAIVKRIKNKVFYCEISETNRKYLAVVNAEKLCDDFFELKKTFKKIIANPPFSKNQDVDHILKMYELLEEGGTLVSLSSRHWENAKEIKCKKFREFLEEVCAEIYPVEAGRFEDTKTACNIIKIKKL